MIDEKTMQELIQQTRLGLSQRAPALRLNQQGLLEVFNPFEDEPDTHDEWRAMNEAPGDPGR